MACIGLYDIELWHRGKAMPNLELMKIYNYHYNKGDKVVMMRPNENEGRFNQIIYFKDNPNTQIPKTLHLSGPLKQIYGYGFFNGFYPLEEKYQNAPPSYLPYEPFTEKMSNAVYNKIKKSSFIRLENQDFSDYNESKTWISFADRNLLYVDGAKEFFHEHKNHRYFPLHSLNVKDEATFLNFVQYTPIMDRRLLLQFKFSEDLFKTYYNDFIIFDLLNPWEGESYNHFIQRLITMFLYYKVNKANIMIEISIGEKTLLDFILLWGLKGKQLSYQEFYEGNKEALAFIDSSPSEIRVLLKSKPSKMRSQDIDFKGIL